MIYTADTVESDPEVGLTRGGLILFALLSGGDYNKV
jgi:Holliday junction resolvase YEN1